MTSKRPQSISKIAAVQMCSSHVVAENLAITEKYIAEAAANGAKLIVLPEMFAIMGLNPVDKVTQKETFGSGPIQDFLSTQASLHKIWIVAGTIPIACDEPNKIRAASLVINDRGSIVARYDKIHLFDVVISETEKYQESATTQAGSDPIIVSTPFGKIGLSVCYDIRFPELFRYYALNGVDIITIPSAFTLKTGAHWDILSVARAVESFSYIVGSCQGGQHSSERKTYGNSRIINPWGEIVSQIEGVESGILYADINLDYIQSIRSSIPALTHTKKELLCQVAELNNDRRQQAEKAV